MAKKTWNLNLESRNHVVELEHGYFSGKREIRVDNKLIEKSSKFMDTGSTHPFELDGHACIVHIRTNGITFSYDLSVDGYSVTTGKLIAIPQVTPQSSDQVKMAYFQEKVKLENQQKGGASWFYWIAGLSFINSIIFLFNGRLNFVVGLGISQVVDGIMFGIGKELGVDGATIVRVIGLGINLMIIGMFAGFGYLARRQTRWAFIVGMVLYGLDVLILIWAKDVFSILFHLWALVGLYRGLKVIAEIKALESKLGISSEPKVWQ